MGLDRDRFIAGFVGGLSFQLLHPLDVMRVRLQINDKSAYRNVPRYASYRDLLARTVRREGLWALYKGASYSFFTNCLLGAFFVCNEAAKRRLARLPALAERPKLVLFLSSALAVLYNPILVLKTWKLLDLSDYRRTPSIAELFRRVRAQGGYAGFFRGCFLTFTVGLNGAFTVYFNDYFRHVCPALYAAPSGNFLLGGLARLVSSTLCYPLTTVRTRLMQNQRFDGLQKLKYESARECVRETFAAEGLRGFYRGGLANAPRAFLSSGLLFLGYNQTHQWLQRRRAAAQP